MRASDGARLDEQSSRAAKLNIQVLVMAQCPQEDGTVRLVRDVAARLVPAADVQVVSVHRSDAARMLAFVGSPTILVNGEDIEGHPGTISGPACRRYTGPAGLPPEWLLEAALLRAMQPRHILFLCVANSARSQMAEGIARSLAPERVTISSAGSAPATRVNPLAIRALEEIGIDASDQRPKTVDEIPEPPPDAAITLCAEAVCPTYLGRACRVHWGLVDPASARGTEEERLEAFRRVRDVIRRRLQRVFADEWPGANANPRFENDDRTTPAPS